MISEAETAAQSQSNWRNPGHRSTCVPGLSRWDREGVDISLAGSWIEVACHRPPSRRGRDQYAPGQRVRQRSGALLLGRCTWEQFAKIWAGRDDPFSAKWNAGTRMEHRA